MTRNEYNNLIIQTKIYDEINDVSIILSEEENKTFHLTNFVSESPNNLSSIHIEEYEKDIKKKFNISDNENLLLMKVDIKRNDTISTQVEYQFYNSKDFSHLNIGEIFKRRRLDDENSNQKIEIDLPVDWTEEQINNFDELSQKGINAFDSSSEFYIDNCNQFTTSKNKDIFLEDRKKYYYPNIKLCEDGCEFEKYNNVTKKITCNCAYKINTDNYDNVSFVLNPVDEKFNKKNIFENLQSMKCISKIFQPENLKKNPGFIIMILFIIIFVASGLIYLLLAGYLGVKKQIDTLFEEDNIKQVLKDKINKQNLYDKPDDDKEENIIKFSNNNNNNNENNINIGKNSQLDGENIISNSRTNNSNGKNEEIIIINDNKQNDNINNDNNNNSNFNNNNNNNLISNDNENGVFSFNDKNSKINDSSKEGDKENNNNSTVFINKKKSKKGENNDDSSNISESNKKNSLDDKNDLISKSNSVDKSSGEAIINKEENLENKEQNNNNENININ